MKSTKSTKNAYLAKLTEDIQMRSGQTGDTYIMDSPESWIGENKSQEDIIGYRMNLVRGKQLIDIKDLENPFVEKLQDISLASKSIDSEATFGSRPSFASRLDNFSEENMPHGPSAVIEKFDIDAVKWDRQLEKSFYDTDLRASEAVMNLHNKDVPFSAMQKAFSVGAFGLKKNRKLVPTRWSITACDSTLADNLLDEVRHYPILDSYRVYEFSSLNNYYAIILTPTEWQYTAKMAVLDKLAEIKRQSGIIILREAYHGYVPLGVFNVRENIKYAMNSSYKEFETLKDAVAYCGSKLQLPISRYVKQGDLLKELLHSKQTTLDNFFKKEPSMQ